MIDELALRINDLAVVAGLWNDPCIAAFFHLVQKAADRDRITVIRKAYAEFAHLLYEQDEQDWTAYLQRRVLELDNICVRTAAREHEIPGLILDGAMSELDTLSKLAALGPRDFFDQEDLAKWGAYPVDLQAEYLSRLMHISEFGYGEFARYSMFRLKKVHEHNQEYQLIPIVHPDPITFEELYGYEEQQKALRDNTRVLMNGQLTSNALLYGSPGTGKSASVKAVLNEFAPKGLRLIEVGKKDLPLLPDLMDDLSGQPLKFILFIDDLTFQDGENDFAALKAVLEGSASARSRNTVIYATSNRRHMVKETFSSREGDDVHRNETIQETISLSDRFGLRLYYDKPSAKQYASIVEGLCREKRIPCSPDLIREAESFALRQSGRSARAARQFVEQKAAVREE